MQFASKKVNSRVNTAQQNAQILAVVKQLLEKNLIRFQQNTVSVYPQIWKDKAGAINWMQCVYIYCCLKKHIKPKENLHFISLENEELLGEIKNGKAVLFYDVS
jgi:hypothetical protein